MEIGQGEGALRWWQRRWFLALVALATALPLIYPPVAPLVDLPGHIGRYRVELDVGRSPWLVQYYGYRWAPIGNLGVDILVLVLAPLLGLEPAVKLIVLAIPPMTAAGMLWVAREVHGRVPPTAFFAFPFIYSLPFLFGFVNFTLSVALAFLAFALWLRLGRIGRFLIRSWSFAALSLIVFFCHAYGWAMLALMCFSAEMVRLRSTGCSWFRATLKAMLSTCVLALPLAVILVASIGEAEPVRGSLSTGWFDWGAKWIGLYSMLRDRWGPFDVSSVELAAVILVFALLSPKLVIARTLGLVVVLLALSFIILPRYVLDSAYADVRLLPYLFAAGLLAIGLRKPAEAKFGTALALLALAFFAARLAGTTVSLAMAANDQRTKLRALDHMPEGVRVASFHGLPNAEPWALHRDTHLGGLVIARRDGFSNDQWITGSHNLLLLKYRGAGSFAANPSQVVRPNGEGDSIYRTIDQALAQVPRDGFDFIWLINVPPFDRRLVGGLELVWSAPGTMLYRIPHPSPTGANGQLSQRR